tara:strand:- start:480 stop:839 length:360 start_codon:yes stop_codon:yes gene_type:complete
MAHIDFDTTINSSLQVGDMLYYTSITQAINSEHTSASGIAGKPLIMGEVTSILAPEGKVYYTPNGTTTPFNGDFILFSKPIQVNESSLKGYYADVTLTNRSNKRAELFAVSSEIALSSK